MGDVVYGTFCNKLNGYVSVSSLVDSKRKRQASALQ